MKKIGKTYKTFDYYITKLVGLIATLILFFFIAVWFGDEWAVSLFPDEISKGFILIPLVVAAYCFNTSSNDRDNWKKKNK